MNISKSSFVAMSITMLAILFLFQFSNIAVQYTSRATTNEAPAPGERLTVSETIQKDDLTLRSTYTTAIIGSDISDQAAIAEEWCVYSKRTFRRFDTLEDYDDHFSKHCKLLIVTARTIQTPKDNQILKRTAEVGIHIIMTQIPSVEQLRASSILRNLLGIKSIEAVKCKTNGVTLYEGFLLGGKTNYPTLKRIIPYFHLKSGTKKYMVGNLKEQNTFEIKNEELPPIIWRNQYDNSFIFGVNWDFFSDHAALGMYTAMVADTGNTYIYPIVNAQSVVSESFPYLSIEDLGDMKGHYYHTSKSLVQNVIWPDLVSILNSTGDKLTGMIAPKMEYSNENNGVSGDSIDYFFKQTEKISGELGLSGSQYEGLSYYEKKLDYDKKNLSDKVPNYQFTIFAPGNMPDKFYKEELGKPGSLLENIQTIVYRKKEHNQKTISYYNDNILSLSSICNGFNHRDREDIYLRSMETALGYCTTSLDFYRVYYPVSKKDDWTILSKNFSRFFNTHWKEFRESFAQTTISEADQRARKFLALNYTSHRQDNTLNLTISNFHEQASFIVVLTNENIISMEGGTFKKIEKDRFLITADKKDLVMEIEPTVLAE